MKLQKKNNNLLFIPTYNERDNIEILLNQILNLKYSFSVFSEKIILANGSNVSNGNQWFPIGFTDVLESVRKLFFIFKHFFEGVT